MVLPLPCPKRYWRWRSITFRPGTGYHSKRIKHVHWNNVAGDWLGILSPTILQIPSRRKAQRLLHFVFHRIGRTLSVLKKLELVEIGTKFPGHAAQLPDHVTKATKLDRAVNSIVYPCVMCTGLLETSLSYQVYSFRN